MRLSRLLAILALVSPVVGRAHAQPAPRFVNPAALSAPHGYSHVALIPSGSRVVYISGQVPLDKDGKLVGAGDFRLQAEQVFTNLKLAVSEVGGTFADVVKLNFYVRDVSHLPELRGVRDRYVNTAHPPASTLVEIRGLFREDVLLEVEAVAVIRERSKGKRGQS